MCSIKEAFGTQKPTCLVVRMRKRVVECPCLVVIDLHYYQPLTTVFVAE